MWLSRRERSGRADQGGAERGFVTLEGVRPAVYAQGERRSLPVYGPGGYFWAPALGEQVLVVKLGDGGEQPCVAGRLMEEELEPGEVLIRADRGAASIRLTRDGALELNGRGKINGVDIG